MNKKQRSALRRFRRVQEFLTTNQVAGTTVKLQVLNDVIRQLWESGEEQDVSDRVTRGETARQRSLRNALWDRHMVPLARIARRAFGVPGMDVKFSLPRRRADNDAILDAARGMAQAAESHAAMFIQQEGLPQDFVQQLRAAIDELSGALGVRVEGQRRRKTASEAVVKLVQRGNASVEVLDAIVKPRLEGSSDLLAAWKSVKRPIEPGGSAAAGPAEDAGQPLVKVA
jgi:hypothetical protein